MTSIKFKYISLALLAGCCVAQLTASEVVTYGHIPLRQSIPNSMPSTPFDMPAQKEFRSNNQSLKVWYGDPSEDATLEKGRSDVTAKINELSATGNGINVEGQSFNAMFGDAAPGKVKVLSLNFPGGAIITCAEHKSINLSQQNLTYFSNERRSKEFIYPSAALGQSVIFNKEWKLPVPGNGYVKFKARGQLDLYIAISATPSTIEPEAYCVIIGGWNNEGSQIWHGNIVGSTNPIDGFADLKKGADFGNVVTGGMPEAGTTWDDYWVKLQPKGTGLEISWGKGTIVGNNVKQSWIDPKPIKTVRYIGLGGLTPVEYKEIGLNKLALAGDYAVNVPAGFSTEVNEFASTASDASDITVGSVNGQIEAWMIDTDGNLHRYDAHSMSADPWIKQNPRMSGGEVDIVDASASSDGYVAAVDEHGKIHLFDAAKNLWSEINATNGRGLKFDRVSIGNKNLIFAIEEEKNNIYQLVDNNWVLRTQGVGAQIAAGIDGTVIGLNASGEAYVFSVDKTGRAVWTKEMYIDPITKEKKELLLTRVAVGSNDHVWGIHEDSGVAAIWQRVKGVWQQVKAKDDSNACGFTSISVNAGGTVIAVDDDGDIYHMGNTGVVVSVTPETKAKAATATTKAVAAKPKTVSVKKGTVGKRATAVKAGTTKVAAKPKAVKKAAKKAAKKTAPKTTAAKPATTKAPATTATKAAATKTPAKATKPAAKKVKKTTGKKAATKKIKANVTKKKVAKKATTAKKPAAKKATAAKAPAKKATAKAPAKKAATKVAAKKPAAKKAVVKKATTKAPAKTTTPAATPAVPATTTAAEEPATPAETILPVIATV